MEYRIRQIRTITQSSREDVYIIQGRRRGLLSIFGWSNGEFSFGATYYTEKEVIKHVDELRERQNKIIEKTIVCA